MLRRALACGLRPILAGRNPSSLAAQAAPDRLEYRVARLDDAAGLDAALSGVDVVIHVAGPFSATAVPMAEACLRTRTHYLDVTGELPVFERLHAMHHAARDRGVMMMPGVGFAVVPSDCLAAHAVARATDAQFLRIGLSRGDLISRGSAATMVEMINSGVRIRDRGRIRAVPVGRLHHGFDFGDGLVDCTAMSWPDVFTASITTGVPNVTAFTEASALEEWVYQTGAAMAPLLRTPIMQRWLKLQTRLMPRPPGWSARVGVRRVIVVEVEDRWRRLWRCRLSTPDGYRFTADAALAVAQRVLAGQIKPGFATPAGAYGADFVLECDGVEREDLDQPR